MIPALLLRLYPRAWRDRYGGEVAALLAAEPMTARLALDLIAGAVDARVRPQSVVIRATGTPETGEKVMARVSGICAPSSEITFRDRAKSAAWIVAGTAGLTWLSIGLIQFVGRSLAVVTLRYAAFPLALLWASRWTTMKPYSRAAQMVILGVTALIVLGVCAMAASVGHRY